MSGDTLAEIYQRKMSRLQQIIQAGYQVKIEWEFEFDDACIDNEIMRGP